MYNTLRQDKMIKFHRKDDINHENSHLRIRKPRKGRRMCGKTEQGRRADSLNLFQSFAW